MSKFDVLYAELCEDILNHGEKIVTDPKILEKKQSDNSRLNMPIHLAQVKKPTVTYSLPHKVLKFDLSDEFPILTTKFVAFKTALIELFWIYQAESNDVRWLHERGVKIWDEWEIDENGNYMGKKFGKEFAHTIGTAYGWIVNRYKLTESLIETLKTDPTNRRMIISLWQNEWLPTASLPSCVWNTEWNVSNGKLNMLVNVRSNDVPLGMPFNVSQYAMFCYLLAQVSHLEPGIMTYVINNAHIYENQIEGIREQLSRKPLNAPKLFINKDIDDFFKFDNSKELRDTKLINYKHQGRIKMPVTE